MGTRIQLIIPQDAWKQIRQLDKELYDELIWQQANFDIDRLRPIITQIHARVITILNNTDKEQLRNYARRLYQTDTWDIVAEYVNWIAAIENVLAWYENPEGDIMPLLLALKEASE
jgi:hypothetical protein